MIFFNGMSKENILNHQNTLRGGSENFEKEGEEPETQERWGVGRGRTGVGGGICAPKLLTKGAPWPLVNHYCPGSMHFKSVY